MKKISLALVAVASLGVAACNGADEAATNDTNMVDLGDTGNEAVADVNAAAADAANTALDAAVAADNAAEDAVNAAGNAVDATANAL